MTGWERGIVFKFLGPWFLGVLIFKETNQWIHWVLYILATAPGMCFDIRPGSNHFKPGMLTGTSKAPPRRSLVPRLVARGRKIVGGCGRRLQTYQKWSRGNNQWEETFILIQTAAPGLSPFVVLWVSLFQDSAALLCKSHLLKSVICCYLVSLNLSFVPDARKIWLVSTQAVRWIILLPPFWAGSHTYGFVRNFGISDIFLLKSTSLRHARGLSS